MTNEELVREIQSGKTEKMSELWEQVRRYVWQQARRRRYVEQEDLCQSGYIALAEAVGTYKEDGGMSFLNWFTYYLRTGFKQVEGRFTVKQGNDPLHHAISLDAPLDDEEAATLGDIIADPAANVEEQTALHVMMEAALQTLPERQQMAVRRRYYWELEADSKEVAQAIKALRRPDISRPLRAFW